MGESSLSVLPNPANSPPGTKFQISFPGSFAPQSYLGIPNQKKEVKQPTNQLATTLPHTQGPRRGGLRRLYEQTAA